jgi:hypothetical protein
MDAPVGLTTHLVRRSRHARTRPACNPLRALCWRRVIAQRRDPAIGFVNPAAEPMTGALARCSQLRADAHQLIVGLRDDELGKITLQPARNAPSGSSVTVVSVANEATIRSPARSAAGTPPPVWECEPRSPAHRPPSRPSQRHPPGRNSPLSESLDERLPLTISKALNDQVFIPRRDPCAATPPPWRQNSQSGRLIRRRDRGHATSVPPAAAQSPDPCRPGSPSTGTTPHPPPSLAATRSRRDQG